MRVGKGRDQRPLAELHARGILPEIATIASEARKYLGRRRAQDNTLEQMMAAKIAFERFVREKRVSIARRVFSASGNPENGGASERKE